LEIDISDTKNISFKLKSKTYNLSDFKYVWYRRSVLNFSKHKFLYEKDLYFENQIQNQLNSEIHYLQQFVETFLFKNSLNKRSDVFLNKLSVLNIAHKIGLNIPTSKIISSKENLIKFYKNEGALITKNYSPGVFVNFKNGYLNSYTTEIKEQEINSLNKYFHPMLFQKKIEKTFEIRSFYISNKFYSIAIMSQNDEKTKLDFRNYNKNIPNRTPPYNLPKIIENRLSKLMNNLELNSGSIDLLVDKKGHYFFLEINPIGQFYQVSKPCNYLLEKKIANYLINQSHEKSRYLEQL
jgi:ATP-GRASP peptide maturase of grasp-with-spasm system